MTITRKYSRSVGEADDFDANGMLRDRKLTPTQAREMVAILQRVPFTGLGSEQISIEFVYTDTARLHGKCWSKTRRMQFFPSGQNENTMIHELAHIAAPPTFDVRHRAWDRHAIDFKLACKKLELVWLKVLEGKKEEVEEVMTRSGFVPVSQTQEVVTPKAVWYESKAPAIQKSKMTVEFNEDTNRWEAENPSPTDRMKLRDAGWKWDVASQVWFTVDEQIAQKVA